MDFVNWVKETFLSIRNDEKEIPQLKRLKPKVSLETILQAVSDEFGCSKEMILEKGNSITSGNIRNYSRRRGFIPPESTRQAA